MEGLAMIRDFWIRLGFGMGMILVYAGCQGPGGTQSKGASEQAPAVDAPVLKLGFSPPPEGPVGDKKDPLFQSAVGLAFDRGVYASSRSVRIPERDRLVLILESAQAIGIKEAAFQPDASLELEKRNFEFVRQADGALVLPLEREILIAAIRSESQTLRGTFETSVTEGGRRSYGVEIPLSMALPTISIQAGGRITGKHLSQHPGVIGRDLGNGDLLAEDITFENPSWVPLKVFVRLATRGVFKQVARMDYFPAGADLRGDFCKLGTPANLIPRYYWTTYEAQGFRLLRTRNGVTETEELEMPSDWLVLTLSPQEKVQVVYRLAGVSVGGRTPLPPEAYCQAFDLRRLSPGSYDHTDNILFHGWRLRGSVHRTLVVAMESLGVREVEDALAQGGGLGEKGRILTGPGGANAPLLSTASFETRYGRAITDSEWENPSPSGKYSNAIIDIGSSM